MNKTSTKINLFKNLLKTIKTNVKIFLVTKPDHICILNFPLTLTEIKIEQKNLGLQQIYMFHIICNLFFEMFDKAKSNQ